MDFLMSVRHKYNRDTVKWEMEGCGQRTTNGGRQKIINNLVTDK